MNFIKNANGWERSILQNVTRTCFPALIVQFCSAWTSFAIHAVTPLFVANQTFPFFIAYPFSITEALYLKVALYINHVIFAGQICAACNFDCLMNVFYLVPAVRLFALGKKLQRAKSSVDLKKIIMVHQDVIE